MGAGGKKRKKERRRAGAVKERKMELKKGETG